MLSKIIGGSITGYVTNLLAIKMLFKKFGPFGGVIVKTKEEFIQKTSALVEREVINHKTLEEEIDKKIFKDSFGAMIQDFFSHHLPDQFNDLCFEDIEGFQESVENLLRLLENEGQPILYEAISSLLQTVNIEGLVSHGQIQSIMDMFLSLLLRILRDGSSIDELIRALYEELKNRKLDSFIPPKILFELSKNFKKSTEDLHLRMKEELGEELLEVFDRIYESLQIPEILQELERSISQKTLLEIVGQDSANDLTRDILERLISSLKTPEGRSFLEALISILLDFLKGLPLSPLHLLNQDLREGLESFLERELPSLIHQGLQWIQKNKEDLEDLIDETLEERLAKGSGIRNWIKKRIVDSFMSISKEYGIVNKILEGVENRVHPHAMAQEMSHRILGLLREKTIGEIVDYLEKTGLLQREDVAEVLIQQLDSISNQVDISFLQPFYHTKLGDLFPIHLVERYGVSIKNFFKEQGIESLVYNRERVSQIQERMMEKVFDALKGDVEELIKEEDLPSYMERLKKSIIKALNKEEKALAHHLAEEASSFLKDKNLFYGLEGENAKKIVDAAHSFALSHLSLSFHRAKPMKIRDVLQQLEKREPALHHLTILLHSLLLSNMELLVSGKIQDLVAQNLLSLSDEEIQRTVEDFLGAELKPITTLGAIMGSLAGLGLYIVQSPALMASPSLSHYLLSSFIYGGVGFVTNKVAIQMVFKPYEKKEIFGKTIPFTPGLAAKNKPRFAKGMGHFIEETLLTAGSIEVIFQEKREEIRDVLVHQATKDNYQMLNHFLQQNQAFIVSYAYDNLFSFLSNSSHLLSSHLASGIGRIQLSQFDLSNLEREVERRGQGLFLAGQERFSPSLFDGLKRDAPIREVIPSPLLQWIHQGLAKEMRQQIHSLTSSLQSEKELLSLIESQGIFDRYYQIQEKSLREVLGHRKEALEEQLISYLFGEENTRAIRGRFLDFLERALQKEMQPERRIDSLFSGLFQHLFESNGDLLIQNIYSFSIKSLRENRETIYEELLAAIDDNLTVIQRIGFLLLDTEETVKEVIDELLDFKIPAFFQSKRDQLKGILEQTLKNLGEKQVGDLGIHIERDGIERVLLFLLEQEPVVQGFKIFFSKLVNLVTEIPVGSILEIISFEKPHHILHVFQKESNALRNHLYERFLEGEEAIHRDLSAMMSKGFDRLLLSQPLKSITESIGEEDVEDLLQTLIHTIYHSEAFPSALRSLVSNLFLEIQSYSLQDFLDEEILREDAHATVKSLLTNKKTSSILIPLLDDLILLLLEDKLKIIEPSTKEHALKRAVDGALYSLEDHLLQLFHSFDLVGITQREITKMNPKEIEDLFYSFASEYLKQVIRFGWAGGGIGLITEFIARLFS